MSESGVLKPTRGRARRRKAVRKKISGTAERPRLAVFRGNRGMSCQVIDDELGVTLASASSMEKQFRSAKGTSKTDVAKLVGEACAKRAVEKGVTKVVFDRGGYKYHGRVKALADSARENGLVF
ncbi:MAG: 50S ribosomal protein L18 [Actinomycetota bacterium]